MPIRKYFCEYCEKQFQDTPSDRKRHNAGIQHQQAKARWYDSFKPQQQQNPTPRSNQPFCLHFVNKGFCRFGDSCKYFHPNTQQLQQPGNVAGDSMRTRMGVSLDNLPPSLQPPPEGGYPELPFVDWG
ncbi:zinc finger CCCH domain-containing protein 3 [Cicer arietinum]|uniref:Zinc finger CCCH domain-containing protein 3 n=1 Tax=Cicer arietinum TaxID=3827 RepID=A0A1S2XWH4_CICAR|nr:zinc finger CCCH domain-containing protein 3 [Cicer arietinum]XP_004495630.1 zinc finger CCCH domain-containing protein 3 [Cicer arietinum]